MQSAVNPIAFQSLSAADNMPGSGVAPKRSEECECDTRKNKTVMAHVRCLPTVVAGHCQSVTHSTCIKRGQQSMCGSLDSELVLHGFSKA